MTKRDKKIMILLFLNMTILVVCMVGVTLNFKVIIENDGRMPVYQKHLGYKLDTERHFTFENKSEISHFYLADIIPISRGIFSIGDIVMIFSVAIFISNGVALIKLFYWTEESGNQGFAQTTIPAQ
jgi:hypothetical protein